MRKIISILRSNTATLVRYLAALLAFLAACVGIATYIHEYPEKIAGTQKFLTEQYNEFIIIFPLEIIAAFFMGAALAYILSMVCNTKRNNAFITQANLDSDAIKDYKEIIKNYEVANDVHKEAIVKSEDLRNELELEIKNLKHSLDSVKQSSRSRFRKAANKYKLTLRRITGIFKKHHKLAHEIRDNIYRINIKTESAVRNSNKTEGMSRFIREIQENMLLSGEGVADLVKKNTDVYLKSQGISNTDIHVAILSIHLDATLVSTDTFSSMLLTPFAFDFKTKIVICDWLKKDGNENKTFSASECTAITKVFQKKARFSSDDINQEINEQKDFKVSNNMIEQIFRPNAKLIAPIHSLLMNTETVTHYTPHALLMIFSSNEKRMPLFTHERDTEMYEHIALCTDLYAPVWMAGKQAINKVKLAKGIK